VGKPRLWEVISEAFGGKHSVESVIKKAKELGENKVSDSDSYVEFLKKRKPNDKKIESENQELGDENNAESKDGGVSWAATELLKTLLCLMH
jgi:hypothetical protein